MACATAVVSSSAISNAPRLSASTRRHHIGVLARPTGKAVCFNPTLRSQRLAATAGYGNCTAAGAWGPVYSQRWRNDPRIQQSFAKWADQAANNMWFPVDTEETDAHYTFVADVPGLGKDDIKVQVNKDQVLSISGERQQRSSSASTSSSDAVEVEEADAKHKREVHRRRQERRFGTFKRTWNLPEDADVSRITASVDQGVLSLVISRMQPAEPEVTNIPIN